ncbi:major facilitator superfamily domain-containing protein [Fusarium flagelliforme]|uniref:Quinidine resistance protein 3 n=1 Tax=Fusarium flagelliforme TaxID=2675880 RepID=A0A395MZ37_9HYPO|nr:major facilitator superfamily domain-containing protein [Fusarium flagelliforme]KAH7192648.1 major facilitator superfamily domain-containing protein [Fusarium flagelliforme]RFN52489.1 quinidine resistance protein 3 [Fusarium flagelliforme]
MKFERDQEKKEQEQEVKNEKISLERDEESQRPATAESSSGKSEHNDQDTIEPVMLGEPLGHIDTRPSLKHAQSRASSARSKALSVVPRSKRRGLLARLTLVPEIAHPPDYKSSTKWFLTFIVALATAAAPLGSTVVYPALPILVKEFNTTETITNLSVALYMISMAIFPLWWSSFSEEFGRRSIYLISFSMFVVFSVLSAISKNITMLIIFRMCAGGASASAHSTGAGSIADLFEVYERGRAMSIFYLGPLLGPMIAPVVGGALTQEIGWQATMWFLAIYGLVVLLMILFFLPETLKRKPEAVLPTADTQELSRMRTMDSAKVKTKNLAKSMRRFIIDPLGVLLYLRFPPVLITVLLAAIAFGSLYVVNIAIQQKFSREPYNFGQLSIGLMYIPSGLGYIVGSLCGGRWIDKIMAREARKAGRYDEDGKLIYLPEDRMRENAWVMTTMYPLALLMFGWVLRYGLHPAVPCVALFLFGISSMLVFSVATTMLTELIRKRSSSGVAVNNFARNTLSCIGAIVAAPWIEAIDVGWVFTILCICCLIISYISIYLLRKNATKWRKTMDEALGQ